MHQLIFIEVTRLISPFVRLMALIVMVMGHLVPGGGFSGGSLLGVAYLLEDLAGKPREVDFLSRTASLLLLYTLVKGITFLFPGIHPPLGTPGAILSAGLILPLNLIVGHVVGEIVYHLYRWFGGGEAA